MSIAACVLAAGRGQRMGTPKAAVLLHGRSLASLALDSFRAAGASPRFIVVAGDGVEPEAEWLALAQVLVNPDPSRGMLSSLHVCLEALRGGDVDDIEGILVTPVDCPRVQPSTIARLISAALASRAPLVVPRWQGRRGHPAYFAAALFDELRAAPFDQGARAVVRAHAHDRLELDVEDPAVVEDFDTPADLAAAAISPNSSSAAGDLPNWGKATALPLTADTPRPS